MTSPSIQHDPDSTLDWVLDLGAWLAGDAIDGVPTATVVDGDVQAFSAAANAAPIYVSEAPGKIRVLPARSAIVFWLTGGSADSRVRLRFTTLAGRTQDVTIAVQIADA